MQRENATTPLAQAVSSVREIPRAERKPAMGNLSSGRDGAKRLPPVTYGYDGGESVVLREMSHSRLLQRLTHALRILLQRRPAKRA